MIDVHSLDNLLHGLRHPVDHDYWAHRLRIDPTFAVQMQVCREWRIPHSTFLGGAEDPDGYPLPPGVWTEDDREKAVAFVIHEAQRCKDCGTHPIDWPEETTEGFHVEGSFCWGCRATGAWMNDYRDASVLKDGKTDESRLRGVRTRIVRDG